uniref:Uncharacterized protein n=1 Tax=Panagrolaimus sp. JU765 TaxID=591449 RepID=A0AC34RGH3_9BILA
MGERYKCPQSLTFECDAPNCCEYYRMSFIFLLVSIGILILAILVLVIWLAIQFRPSKLKAAQHRLETRRRSTLQEIHQLEEKSDEEAKYLRRMSEINPRHSKTHELE